MCRMSARWLLCNYCRSSCCKTSNDVEAPHTYCGCQSDRRAKMLHDRAATTDVDKQILISQVYEAIDYDFGAKTTKEESEIDNPKVPFSSEFCDKLEANRAVIIYGKVKDNALNFTVNFCKGSGEEADIGFHLNPRFDQHYVPRNCRLNRGWGDEEAQTYCKYPFTRGKQFYIEVFLTHNEYLVAINGLHFCAFNFRYPVFELDTIQILGDVSLHKVKFIVAECYPSELPKSCDIESGQIYSIPAFVPEKYTLELTNCSPPHVISLKQPMGVGNEIEISGRAKLLPYTFYINLQQGTRIWPHPLISLHLNARFREMSSTTRSVLVNSWDGKGWGKEEFASENCFFLPGQSFTLHILCTTDAFHVSHNNQRVILLEHRTDYTKVDTLYIVGDVLLNSVSFL